MMRVLIIGLDCAPPSLVFERWAGHLPHLTALRERGMWGPLRSTSPPITVPAWACMTSGRDPGELGLYGFRNRTRQRDYGLQVARSSDVRVKRLWDRAGHAGKKVASLFVPLTSPPTPVRGLMVSCFLSAPHEPWAFPPAQQRVLSERFGEYKSDVSNFRADDLERIFDELDAMREQHFAIAHATWQDEPDFLMMVEMGPDRLHHAAWQYIDPRHPSHDPNNPWLARALRYYVELDAEVGRLANAALKTGDTQVFIVSDHGAKAALGGVALNDWLWRNGWLSLKREPDGVTPLRELVDFPKTKAWAEGGYYGRLFFNVIGREPNGVVPAKQLEAQKSKLIDELRAALAEQNLALRADRPETIYAETKGEPPDLMLYLADLDFRALGTVGHDHWIVKAGSALSGLGGEGPGLDGCNHDWDGIFIAAGPGIQAGYLADANILDVAPTALASLGLRHDDLVGRNLLDVQ